MKKLFILFILCVVLFSLCQISFASSYLDGTIMSDPLGAGKMDISGKIDCFIGSEVVNLFIDEPEWALLSDALISSVTSLVIPLKFAYGVTDALSLRATLPYVSSSVNSNGSPINGSGIGDARLEGLYRFVKESGGMPSIAANLGIKFATGKYKGLEANELPVGTGGTDYYLSFIFGKKLGPVNGKALLGYAVMGRIDTWIGTPSPPEAFVDPAEQLLFSLSLAYPVNESFEIGGELWGNSCGQEIIRTTGNEQGLPYSQRLQAYLSPYIAFMPSPGLSLRAAIDYPLSVPAVREYGNIWNSFRF
ncbi:MAG: transporter [Candidatus Saganbacteria bacterium]|nr:transporter [Candidatus Saganbacteria bacterium]